MQVCPSRLEYILLTWTNVLVLTLPLLLQYHEKTTCFYLQIYGTHPSDVRIVFLLFFSVICLILAIVHVIFFSVRVYEKAAHIITSNHAPFDLVSSELIFLISNTKLYLCYLLNSKHVIVHALKSIIRGKTNENNSNGCPSQGVAERWCCFKTNTYSEIWKKAFCYHTCIVRCGLWLNVLLREDHPDWLKTIDLLSLSLSPIIDV